MAKAKSDPLAPVRDKIHKLTIHLQVINQRLNSKTVPERQKTRAEAYLQWLALESKRTKTKLENLKLSLPAGG